MTPESMLARSRRLSVLLARDDLAGAVITHGVTRWKLWRTRICAALPSEQKMPASKPRATTAA